MVMKKILILGFLSCLFAAGGPQNKAFGVGAFLQVGPIHQNGFGATGSFWLDDNYSIDSYLRLANDFSSVDVTAIYQMHYWDIFKHSAGKIPVYWGFGGGLGLWKEGYAIKGLVSVGLEYQFDNAPVALFSQIDPQLEVDFYDKEQTEWKPTFLWKIIGARFFF